MERKKEAKKKYIWLQLPSPIIILKQLLWLNTGRIVAVMFDLHMSFSNVDM